MAYWELTEDVWWGDVDSIREVGSKVKSAICVASDNDLLEKDGYDILNLNDDIPYFRIARDDHDPVDGEYMQLLDNTLELVYQSDLFPTLIHCYAGSHRSPAVAIYMAFQMGDPDLDSLKGLRKKVRQLRPDKKIKEDWPFHKSLIDHILEELS